MAIKNRWLALKTDCPFNDLANALTKMKFTPFSDFGFQVDECESNIIKAKYINKIIRSEVIEDPFGNITRSTFDSYESVPFSLFRKRQYVSLLRVDSAPRSYSTFLNSLSTCVGYPVYLEKFCIDPMNFCSSISEKYSHKIMQKLVSAVVINENTLAKFEFSATDGSSLHDEVLSSKYKHQVDGVRAKLFSRAATGEVSLSRTGLSSITGHLSNEISKDLRQFFLSNIK